MQAQQDTIASPNKNLNLWEFALPTAGIVYGIVALESHTLQTINTEVKEELHENIDRKLTIDDFTQYAPIAAVYALNNLGYPGKHNLKDRSIILVTSYLIMSSTILTLKNTSNVLRPDGSATNSFPSGHTATAFMGAEFLWQEYKDSNIWYGIAGYAVAAGTGFFRIYNDRHWVSDVAMGMGVGIMSTKIAYWLYPTLQRNFFQKNKNTQIALAPFYTKHHSGMGAILIF